MGSNSKTEAVEKKFEDRSSRYISWAELLKKTWGIDLFHCQACGCETKIIGFVSDSRSLGKIIKSLGLETRAPPQKLTFEHCYELVEEGESPSKKLNIL